MKKAIIHQHYWAEDEADKNTNMHRQVLHVFTNEPQEEQDRIFNVWTRTIDQAKKNMVGAAKILDKAGVIKQRDFSLFKDDVFIENVSDETVLNMSECMHIIQLSKMRPNDIAQAMIALGH